MPLIFNLRHLDRKSLELAGELSVEELDLDGADELIEMSGPLGYDLVLERLPQSVLVRGQLSCALACQCVRCLRGFTLPLELDDWVCDLPLEGEDKVVVTHDFIDLTPYVREDILLAFPQHPLCEPDCRGLLKTEHNLNEAAGVDRASDSSSAWAALNKLKF